MQSVRHHRSTRNLPPNFTKTSLRVETHPQSTSPKIHKSHHQPTQTFLRRTLRNKTSIVSGEEAQTFRRSRREASRRTISSGMQNPRVTYLFCATSRIEVV